jgi:hypothetical protein
MTTSEVTPTHATIADVLAACSRSVSRVHWCLVERVEVHESSSSGFDLLVHVSVEHPPGVGSRSTGKSRTCVPHDAVDEVVLATFLGAAADAQAMVAVDLAVTHE